MKDFKEELRAYLDTQQVMALATRGDRMESCTVFFSVDKDLNIYFISDPETEHCKNIRMNKEVACSIADSRQRVADRKIGVQIKGAAVELSDLEKVGAALAFWSKANAVGEAPISVQEIKKRAASSKAYRITPVEIKFFNEELFGLGNYEIIRM